MYFLDSWKDYIHSYCFVTQTYVKDSSRVYPDGEEPAHIDINYYQVIKLYMLDITFYTLVDSVYLRHPRITVLPSLLDLAKDVRIFRSVHCFTQLDEFNICL